MADPRTFTLTVITEVEFVDPPNNETMQNYLKHLTEDVKKAADALSLRTVKDHRVRYCSGGVVS